VRTLAVALEKKQIDGWRFGAPVSALMAVSIAIHSYHYGIED
jgi:hypothetical protein